MESKEMRETLICQCHSVEHQVSFTWVEDKDLDGEVYMEIHLKPLPFWERLKNGICYIFGRRSIFGDFDEIILRKSDVSKLQKVIDFLRK